MSFTLSDNTARLKKLKAQLEHVPQKPGIYIHKGAKNEILYVGKAKNLKSRLKSYFTSLEQHSLKTKALVDKIEYFEIIVTDSEYESLLLENNLIKHHLPPYNILLRDDKTYPYLKIDRNEAWPRIVLTRRRKKDGGLYFGPYTLPGQIHRILNVINRFFPLVKCTPTVFKNVSRPCNYYDIKKCLGPCKLPIDKSEYMEHLNTVIAILQGKQKDIIKKLHLEMKKAASELDFEKAAIIRDQANSISNLAQNQSISLDIPIFIDIIGYFWSDTNVVFYVSFIRNGNLVGGNSIVIENIFSAPPNEEELSAKEQIFSNFVCQYYSKKEIPDYIFLDKSNEIFSKENIKNIEQYFQKSLIKNDSRSVSFLVNMEDLLKNIHLNFKLKTVSEYKKLLLDIANLSNKNAENKFREQIKIEEASNNLLLDLQNILQLKSIPRIIECYDISTFQGSQTVASQVCFKDGAAYKKNYRKYIIKDTFEKTDDFASLREVIRRRFKQIDNLPDLVVIDGGTPQIREISWTLKSLGLENLAFIGLAKSRIQNQFSDTKVTSSQERIIIPYRENNGYLCPDKPSKTLILQEGSPAFRLLTQLRDEAHRFAITFHRKKRDKASLKSVLFEIPGLGNKRRKKLLEACPDLTELKNKDLTELSKVTKIPIEILNKAKEIFANTKKSEI